MMDTLKITDKDGKPIGSGQKITFIDKLCVDKIPKLNFVSNSSYIETPSKFKQPKCGLVNIQNNDQQCFKILYVISSERQENNDFRVSALKKNNILMKIFFPVNYEDMVIFQEVNNISVMAYGMVDDDDLFSI